ncbi:hypothetical protein N9204_00395 [bacterium]|nr:hypothetical protein [bacterium]
MRPFSLWHSFVLRQLDNPFAHGIPESGEFADDLVSALAVCSLTYEESRAVLLNERLFSKRLKPIAKRAQKSDLPTVVAAFCSYRSDHCHAPEHGKKDDDRSCVNAPWEFHMVRCLCSIYRMSLGDAWNTGVGMSRCYYDVDMESRGDDSLIGEYDRMLARYIDDIKASRKAGNEDEARKLESQMQAVSNVRNGLNR